EKKKDELIIVTKNGDNSKVIELSKEIAKLEKEAETKFESLEISQTKVDTINDEYQIKLEELM
ncbi:MAG: ABC transporter ATP-binding protein, partial [Arcobacter sp.]